MQKLSNFEAFELEENAHSKIRGGAIVSSTYTTYNSAGEEIGSGTDTKDTCTGIITFDNDDYGRVGAGRITDPNCT